MQSSECEVRSKIAFLSLLRAGLIAGGAGYLLMVALYLLFRVVLRDGRWWLALMNDFAVLVFVPLPMVVVVMIRLRARFWLPISLALGLIAACWFGPLFLPKLPVQASGPVLRVVSFNVWGQNRALAELETWLREIEADVVLLQEIPAAYADQTIPALTDIYPYQASQPTSMRAWGNLFLSRYPIISVENLPGAGVPAQQRLVVAYEEQRLAIYNVHLAMPIGVSRHPNGSGSFVWQMVLRYNPSARNAEIERLLECLRSESYPYVVGGDFNMSEFAAIYTEVATVMTDAYRERRGGVGGTWPVAVVDEIPAYAPQLLRVDYVWHSDHFRAVRAQRGPQLGSDHLPLWVELELAEVRAR